MGISEIYWNLWSDMEKNGGGTESQYHLARRCAGLLALLEVWEQKFCSDKAVPTGTWNATVNTVRRLMQDRRKMLLDQRRVIRAELELAGIGRFTEFLRIVERHDPGPAATDVRLHQDRPSQTVRGLDRIAGMSYDPCSRMPDPEL